MLQQSVLARIVYARAQRARVPENGRRKLTRVYDIVVGS